MPTRLWPKLPHKMAGFGVCEGMLATNNAGMKNTAMPPRQALDAIRDEVVALSHWAYAAADSKADDEVVERIVDRLFGLLDLLEAEEPTAGWRQAVADPA